MQMPMMLRASWAASTRAPAVDCLPDEASDYAEQLCSCLLTWLPQSAYAELPEVSVANLAEYEGPLVLPHWMHQ